MNQTYISQLTFVNSTKSDNNFREKLLYGEFYHNIFDDDKSSLESIADKHLAEWRSSGIDDRITAINLKSLSGESAFDHLLYADQLDRRNDGRLTDGLMYRYRHLENGGWWVNGIDPLTGEDRLFGQFKPDTPYIPKDGKPIKYEQPPKIPYEPKRWRSPWEEKDDEGKVKRHKGSVSNPDLNLAYAKQKANPPKETEPDPESPDPSSHPDSSVPQP
jgi:hypothetical protein